MLTGAVVARAGNTAVSAALMKSFPSNPHTLCGSAFAVALVGMVDQLTDIGTSDGSLAVSVKPICWPSQLWTLFAVIVGGSSRSLMTPVAVPPERIRAFTGLESEAVKFSPLL